MINPLIFFLVIRLTEVITKSMCQPREVLVDIFQEYPEDTEHTYAPSCVVLKRCGGCCNDEAMECVPTETNNITLEVSPQHNRTRFPGWKNRHEIILWLSDFLIVICANNVQIQENNLTFVWFMHKNSFLTMEVVA